jgi:hypothetical protein
MRTGIISRLCAEVRLPRMFKVRQLFDQTRIEPKAIPAAVFEELSKPELNAPIRAGMRVAVTCGSRGVANAAVITKAVADFVKASGAAAFVVPAMGSHGGATAEGQRTLIENYGVTEQFIGCPIVSSMETMVIGQTEDGHPVRIDRNAAEADAIIAVGRVKPHTDFRGPYESGLMKMLAVGLGKREGADVCHAEGFSAMAKRIPLFGSCIIKNAPVALGFAILENAYGQTLRFAALRPDEIAAKEPALLEEARNHLPLILFKEADVLVVDRIGKDISGDGMDPNITGASSCSPYISGGLKAQRTAILGLTPATHGSAFGIGAAHTITRRLFNQIDYEATYINAITSRGIDFVRIPCIAENDREAIQLALRTCIGYDADRPRIIRIADSLHTETIWASEALLREAETNPRVHILSKPEDWPFNTHGNLLSE